MKKASMRTRNEVIHRNQKSYQKATKKQKSEILNHVCQAVGLSRDRAARLLRGSGKRTQRKEGSKRGRKPKYHERTVILLLENMWVMMDCICGKRLVAGMPSLIEALRRHGAVSAPEWAIQKVLSMSPATADRLLKPSRTKMKPFGLSATKPGTLNKKTIPIRTGTDWDENKPGFAEIDLVAHCGIKTIGEYVNSLDVTDVYSGWTETIAVINKAQTHVFTALRKVRARMPFPLLGIDSDNGSEFINHQLYRYCKNEGIMFTRSRPYRKNDNCFVEQKNYTCVRKQLGYGRFEGQRATDLMNLFYERFRLYSNFFLPCIKLKSKHRIDSRIVKKYDHPQTPYQRLMTCDHLSYECKTNLRECFLLLNPMTLCHDIMKLREEVQSHASSGAMPLSQTLTASLGQ